MKATGIILLVTIFTLTSCVEEKEITEVSNASYFIQPPLSSADVPYTKYSVDAELGDTLFHQSGSILIFPSNSFVDKSGNIISGNVDIKYREFTDPLDFYLAGIPLDYDSLGVTYSFESSGICEVLAFQDGNPVFVNPQAHPEINLVSKNTSKTHSIYYLDTVKENWIRREMSVVTDLGKTINEDNSALKAPIKPSKANNKSPIIEIEIDPASFEELMIYNDLKFQLIKDEARFNPKDANEIWNKVELVKNNNKGLYTVKFQNLNRSVSYLAKPVLEGENYQEALLVFERKNAEYKRKLKERKDKEIIEKEEYDRILRLNNLAAARNKALEEINLKNKILNEESNKEIEEENRKLKANYEAKMKEIERKNSQTIERNQQMIEEIETQLSELAEMDEIAQKEMEDYYKSKDIIRSFNIDRFGIWNCDKAFSLDRQWITAKFIDDNGNNLDLRNVAVVNRLFNGIQSFPRTRIQIVKDSESLVFGIYEGKLAYIPYQEVKELNINSSTEKKTFKMTIVPEENSNYEYLKGLK